MADNDTALKETDAPDDIVVTASSLKTSTPVSATDIAKTGIGIVTAPASTTRHKISGVFARAAGQGGSIIEPIRALGDRMNDKQEKPSKNKDGIGNVVNRADDLPVGIIAGGRVAAGISSVNDIIHSKEKGIGTAGEAAKNIAANLADRTGPLIGMAVGGMIGAFDSQKTVNEMKRGIDLLSQKDVPGVEHQTKVINGKTVGVYVSTIDAEGKPAEKPWVYVEDGTHTSSAGPRGGAGKHHNPMADPAISDFVNDVKNKAIGERDQHYQDVSEDNVKRSDNMEYGKLEFEKQLKDLAEKSGMDEDGNFSSKEAEAVYDAGFEKLLAEQDKFYKDNAKRSGTGEIKDKMTEAYAEVDAGKKASVSPQISQLASNVAATTGLQQP